MFARMRYAAKLGRLPFPRRPAGRAPALLLMLLLLPAALLVTASACAPGEPAADFAVTLFNGDEFRLSEQRGRAVVVNFWYPSCPPCREEMPALQQVWQQYQGRQVRVLGLFVPQGFDTEADARHFVDELGLTFDFATDTRARVAQEYAVQYFPTTYFIDQAGRVHLMEIARLDAARLSAILDELVGG